MASTPRLVVEAFEDLADGGKRSLGDVDLTRAFCTLGMRHVRRIEKIVAGDKPILVADISSGLPSGIANVGWKGCLALPGLQESLAAFHGTVVATLGYVALDKALESERRAVEDLEEARQELSRLEGATWCSQSEFAYLYAPEFRNDGYVSASDAEGEAYGEWGWEEFSAGRPRRDWNAPEAERKAWDAEREKWVRPRARPWAFGTEEIRWEGVDAEAIREEAHDGGFDACEHAYNGLSDHHEDAIDKVKDIDALQAAAEAWCASPRPEGDREEPTRGMEADAALEAAVAAWNAVQGIVSFQVDMKKAVPVFSGATREEALAWSRRRVAAAEARLAETRDGPVPVEAVPAP
jgi:hypothetical protein